MTIEKRHKNKKKKTKTFTTKREALTNKFQIKFENDIFKLSSITVEEVLKRRL